MKKNIPYIQYGLDLIMGVTFALFYNDRVLGGLAFHEIAGLVICGAILAHVLFNSKWVKNVTLKLFNRKLPWKTRISYLLNLLLLVTMTAIIVTGIIISRVVFPSLSIGNERWIQMLHISVSYITLVLVAVHIGLHWQWVIQLSKKIFKVRAFPSGFDYMVKMSVVALFLFGAYEMYATGFGSHLASSANIFTGSQQEQGQFEGQKGQGFERGQFERGQFGENGQPPKGFRGDMPTPPDGDFQGNGDGQRGFPGGEMRGEKGRFGESPSALGVIATYFGIMAVFVILTHYLGKIKIKRKESQLM